MRIERNYQTTTAANIEKAAKPATPATGSSVSAFQEAHQLNQAMANTPTVRADQVARAKALIADPNFPSSGQLEKVAGLLANNLSADTAAL